ncbi:MAG: GNAT family N-acetyltransferase [Bacillota bacterium]|nr:GNAT family N-acetyltransferase [Bacillota bacterium]
MADRQTVRFDMYEMEYKGGLINSELSVITLEEKHYEKYKDLINSCYYEMRKELNIQPYGVYCADLEELMEQKENIFLLMNSDEIICTVSCVKNEISKVAVNLKYQHHGYGRKIMEFAISYIQKQGNPPIKLTVTKWNKNAIALYKSLGFEIIKETTVEGTSTKDINGNWTFEFISTDGLSVS